MTGDHGARGRGQGEGDLGLQDILPARLHRVGGGINQSINNQQYISIFFQICGGPGQHLEVSLQRLQIWGRGLSGAVLHHAGTLRVSSEK